MQTGLDLVKFGRFGWWDVLDLFLVAWLLYRILLLIRGTLGFHVAIGLVVLVVFFFSTRALHLRILYWIFENLFSYSIFALIVLYQVEIRRGLAHIGSSRFFLNMENRDVDFGFEEIVQAAATLATKRIGALIILEREIGLRDYIESGIQLDAVLTYDLLNNIFIPNTPLHDGACIIQGRRIAAAVCFLPLTVNPEFSKALGTRHRAAIGITEQTDAVAVVVSEETGSISGVIGGEITSRMDVKKLSAFLHKAFEARSHHRQSISIFKRFYESLRRN
ncbi:MAG: diadenylate cyclase CdaA [Syntrophales bacterium LBB04]|nr:diadenylate cyclase CdaA [Syntrophales bacterium LBB04]